MLIVILPPKGFFDNFTAPGGACIFAVPPAAQNQSPHTGHARHRSPASRQHRTSGHRRARRPPSACHIRAPNIAAAQTHRAGRQIRVIGDDPGERHLLAIDIAAETQRVGDSLAHRFYRHTALPVRLLAQVAVDHGHIQFVAFAGDAQWRVHQFLNSRSASAMLGSPKYTVREPPLPSLPI